MDRMTDLAEHDGLETQLENHRVQLTGYCYRMLGSASEAEDAVQDTLVRAWRGYDRFEGRSTLRSWLYRIATNVCLDMLTGRQRRARPMDLAGPLSAETPVGTQNIEALWIEPAPDSRVLATGADPGDIASSRETVRLAFIAALQYLPPRQRAVLILREVLCFSAEEVAQLLETSVASVNSALQRARARLAAKEVEVHPGDVLDEDQQQLLDRYLEAFERYDIDALTALLHEDASMSMPPYEMWVQGRKDIGGFFLGQGHACRGSRLVPVRANGCGAFGQYRLSEDGSRHEPWALQVIEVSDGKIEAINSFLDTETLFPLFGLPVTLH
jgi:RNA polymerase sigma-70 factor, ECF subfamily